MSVKNSNELGMRIVSILQKHTSESQINHTKTVDQIKNAENDKTFKIADILGRSKKGPEADILAVSSSGSVVIRHESSDYDEIMSPLFDLPENLSE
jgi:hypothetical protein